MKDTSKLRIVFMGTPHFAVGVLSHLVETGHCIVGVITAPDKPAGRGRSLRESAVKAYAKEQGLHILQPTNLKNEEFLQELSNLKADLQIVVAFRMLPEVVWRMPSKGTFNLHASLLPQYRGAAPINWAIINKETETGVTTFFIDDKIDTGAVLLQKTVDIDDRETFETLHDSLLAAGSELVVETVRAIEEGSAEPIPQQSSEELKPAPKLRPENTRINWNTGTLDIDAFIRGLSPYPCAWTELSQADTIYKVKIYHGEPIMEVHSYEPGTVITSKKEIKIATADGWILVSEIQLPGKRKMDAPSLLNGFSFEKEAKMS